MFALKVGHASLPPAATDRWLCFPAPDGGCFGVDGVHQGDVGGHGVGGVDEVLTRGDDGVDLLACSGEVLCAVPDGGTGVRVAWCGGDVCLSAVNVLPNVFSPNTGWWRCVSERRQCT